MALLVLAALTGSGDPTPSPSAESTAGELLVAAPSMGDPRFYHAVILMLRDSKDGAMGIIINHPVGERPLKEILEAAGDKEAGIDGKIRVFLGGPVQTDLGFVIHSTDYRRGTTVTVDDHVAMTADKQILLDIGHKKGPQKTLFAFGYAGWGPGQLQQEMARHDWYTAPDEARLLFDVERDQVWDEAMARRLREL